MTGKSTGPHLSAPLVHCCVQAVGTLSNFTFKFEIINKFLGTETPLFSIEKELFKGKYEYYLSSENAVEILKKIDKKLKFNLTSIVPNKYVVGKTELIFNEVGENLKKNEEIVETMNEETKEDIKN